MPNILQGILEIFKFKIENQILLRYLGIIINIIIILAAIKIIIKISNSIIEKFFNNQKNLKFGMNEKKANTLSELSKSILRYALYFIAIILIFEIVWPNVKTAIALTGVMSVAIGFGAQSLVKDIISGFFILFEDQFAVGDYITIDGKSGNVEVVGLRVTKIRDFSGDLHTIPNGSINIVTNKTRGNMRALVEIDISYDEDLDVAIAAIEEVNESLRIDFDSIVEGPQVLGVTNFGDFGVTIRIIAKTVPMDQWTIEFELRKRIKQTLDAKGIKLGYPKKIIIEDRGKK